MFSRFFRRNASTFPLKASASTLHYTKEIVIPIQNGHISGTLFTPKKSKGLILILPGSGPVDRYGNAPGLQMNIYLKLQQTIEDYSVFLYDKRGVGLSSGFYDNVDDGIAVLQYLLHGIDTTNVYLVGHSEGGWTIAKMYPRLLKLNIKPKGMIFLCGFGMNMKDSLDYQKDQIRISIETMPGFKGWLCRFLRVVKLIEYQAKASMKYLLSTTGDMIRVLWVKVNAKWIREMVQYSVIPDYKVIECDVLAISGGKDVQVPVLEPMARDLLPNASAVRILNIKDMCHVLKIQENQASILNVKSDYKGMADKELAPELIRALNEFLAK